MNYVLQKATTIQIIGFICFFLQALQQYTQNTYMHTCTQMHVLDSCHSCIVHLGNNKEQ